MRDDLLLAAGVATPMWTGAAIRGAVGRLRGTGAEWRGRRYPLAR